MGRDGLTHARVSVMCPQRGQTPVYAAAEEGHSTCVEALVAANADLNIADNVSGRDGGVIVGAGVDAMGERTETHTCTYTHICIYVHIHT